MPAPISYTETELAAYMHTIAGEAATLLGYSVGALARRELWAAVVEATASYHDTTVDDLSVKRSQMAEAAAANLSRAPRSARFQFPI